MPLEQAVSMVMDNEICCNSSAHGILWAARKCAAYCFRVRAFANGKWQDYSTEATKTVQPPKPSKISAAANNNAITLTWAQRKDISGVTIYRSTSKSGNYEQLTNVPQESGATFTDTNIANNQTYYYKILHFVPSFHRLFETNLFYTL